MRHLGASAVSSRVSAAAGGPAAGGNWVVRRPAGRQTGSATSPSSATEASDSLRGTARTV